MQSDAMAIWRNTARVLLACGVALAVVGDFLTASAHSLSIFPPATSAAILGAASQARSMIPVAIAARADWLAVMSLTFFAMAGVAGIAMRSWVRIVPPQRRFPGLEDRLEALTRLTRARVAPPPPAVNVFRLWRINANSFRDLREGLRVAWTQAVPAFSELAVVLNRMDVILDRVGRNDRDIDLMRVAWLREHGNRKIAELRAALHCVLDVLGRDQPTFAVLSDGEVEAPQAVAL
jgi:hypothetical protein